MDCNRSDHLANERTFLSWIRTSLGIMAFGFVVDKFGFFMKHLAVFMQQMGSFKIPADHHADYIQNSSSFAGLILILIGTLLCILSFIRFKKLEKEINDDINYSTGTLEVILAFFICSIGICLAIYTYFAGKI